MKKKRKRILPLAILLLLIAGAAIYFGIQPQKQVSDTTEQAKEEETPEESGSDSSGSGEENTVVLSSSTTLLLEDKAEKVNDSIQSIYCNDEEQLEIIIGSEAKEVVSGLGPGDIFFLDGNENSPFGSPYIGKVSTINQKEDGSVELVTQTPSMDEAFESVNVDMEASLTEESVTSVSGIEGVSIEYTENVAAVYDQIPSVLSEEEGLGVLSYEDPATQMNTLKYTNQSDGLISLNSADGEETGSGIGAGGTEIKGEISPEGFVLQYDIDLLELIDIIKGGLPAPEAIPEGNDKNDEEYGAGRDTADETTEDKIKNDLIESHNRDTQFTLKGKIALTDLSMDIKNDWDLKRLFSPSLGFNELSYSLKYKYETESAMTLCAENLSFGGTKNEFNLLDLNNPGNTKKDNSIVPKLSGLKDKLIPIACIQWVPSHMITMTAMDGNQMNNLIHINAGMSPLSVALIFYVDISGNISASFVMQYDQHQNFDGGFVFVRDGQWVCKGYGGEDKDIDSWQMEASITADADFHTGVAVDVYLFNVSIIDVNVVKVGAEGNGSGGVKMGSLMPEPQWFADIYMRTYLKILDTHINMKLSCDMDLLEFTTGIKKDWILKDFTLAQTGKRRETNYNPYTMSYAMVTASDEKYVYYLDEHNIIVRQDRENGKVDKLYDGGMTIFCGIDETYLYILKNADDAYDLYRVDKKTGTGRCVETGVLAVLEEDKNNLYYLSSSDEKTIQAFNRYSMNSRTLKSFDDNVQVMQQYGDNYYVVTEESGLFASIWGGEINYYLIDREGNTICDYGSSPEITYLPRKVMPTYYELIRYIERGLLREASAEEVYWMGEDNVSVVKTEEVSGWSAHEDGIFVTQENDMESEKKYTIFLYQAVDGQKIKVTDVFSDQAFFTLCQDSAGNWYYFDECGDELILYEMDSHFGNLTEVVRYNKSEIKVSLKECSMEIIGNKMIFYSITGNDNDATTKVHYRYNVY